MTAPRQFTLSTSASDRQRKAWVAWGRCYDCGVPRNNASGKVRCELHAAIAKQRSRKCRAKKAARVGQ
jgi:hypothetical protein